MTDFDRLTRTQAREFDDLLVTPDPYWWDTFYQDRAKPCPFFERSPDESLAEWIGDGLVRPGRAIDLGCGNGRNAIFLARLGFSAEGIDYSHSAIDWARERATAAGTTVALTCGSVFDWQPPSESYDFVYDSGCFHHIPPHRRKSYVEQVVGALKPRAWFGLTCFTPEGGSGYSDTEVYERASMGGGLGYSAERLREIWSRGLEVRIVRPMVETLPESGLFGKSFLQVLLAQKA